MEVRDIRLKSLRALVEKAGGIAAFARQHPGVDPTYVSQLINGHRSFGERAARNMESKIGFAAGSLDRPEPSQDGITPSWPFLSISAARYAAIPDRLKGRIEERALSIIEEWEAESVKSPASSAAA